MPDKVGRVAAYVMLFLLGVVIAFLGAFTQAAYPPAGLIVALAGSGGLFVAGGSLLKTKAGAAVPVAGWMLTVLFFASWTKPEGDWIFVSGFLSYVYLFGGTIFGVAAATFPWGGHKPVLLSGESLKTHAG
ncbi:DUF6113 family protein [Embleya sp. NBC_00896]|uniref:DUF6113 family protein n=1 Tax=Embleya sp. NBC_00896 TaxID=2975961 RepID=UPI00386B2E25|nr:DUF6113 family protein [Embleya sp. NBC_00896]